MQIKFDISFMILKSSGEKGRVSYLLFFVSIMTERGDISLQSEGDMLWTECQDSVSNSS